MVEKGREKTDREREKVRKRDREMEKKREREEGRWPRKVGRKSKRDYL